MLTTFLGLMGIRFPMVVAFQGRSNVDAGGWLDGWHAVKMRFYCRAVVHVHPRARMLEIIFPYVE